MKQYPIKIDSYDSKVVKFKNMICNILYYVILFNIKFDYLLII